MNHTSIQRGISSSQEPFFLCIKERRLQKAKTNLPNTQNHPNKFNPPLTSKDFSASTASELCCGGIVDIVTDVFTSSSSEVNFLNQAK